MALSFLKYHGHGNDFLVCLDGSDLPGGDEVDADFVAELCDRHRGVGADGVMVVRPATGRGDVRMELRNADGGRAEMSGNGLRCLALALVDAGICSGPDVLVETDAGLRTVSIVERLSDDCSLAKAEMGTLLVGPEELAPLLGNGFQARHVDVGNPHLVFIGADLEGVDIVELGRSLEDARPGGQNVEVATPDSSGGLELLVWERGAGVTEACGTGSCAAAAAARAAGLVGDHVRVQNPGGVLDVDLSGDLQAPTVWLSGPACRVARIEIIPSGIDVLG
ncbi:MAG: diaminopimelate epimerase [Acidimicrobiales bacterium]